MNSLHPSFTFSFATSSCFRQPDGTWHCLGPSGKPLGVGKTQALAQADLNRQLSAPKPKHHHIHHPPKHSVSIQGNTFAKATKPVPVKPKPKPKPAPTTAPKPKVTQGHFKRTPVDVPVTPSPKPVQTQFLKDALATGKKLSTTPAVTTGTAPTATGQNPIKQALNKNQHKVITTSSPSSPTVNDTPTTDTTTPDTTATPPTDTTTTPTPDSGNQTNVLLIGGAIFVGLMVLLLIV